MTDQSMRDEFEATYSRYFGAPREMFGMYQDPEDPEVWYYLQRDMDNAWFFWQAATRQALERAATKCLDLKDTAFFDHAAKDACQACADSIRALEG